MRISSIGIDLGKTTFHLIALDDHSKIVIKKKFSHKQLLAYTAKLQPALVGIEACSGAHFIGARLRDQGHDVRLIPAVRETLREVKQKRFHRCGSDCRSRYSAEYAFCAYQDRYRALMLRWISIFGGLLIMMGTTPVPKHWFY